MKNKAFFFIFALFLAGCSGVEISNPVITKAENGSTLHFKNSADFSVILAGNPTTGYMWKISSIDTTKISPVGNYEYKSSGNQPGASGDFTFKFKTLSRGGSLLKFYYLRSWEKGITPIDSFKVNISIN